MKLYKCSVLVLLLSCLIITTNILTKRINIENENNSYNYMIDYNEFYKLSLLSEYNIYYWLNKFSEEGINNLVITEETFQSLEDEGKIEINTLSELKKDINWQKDYPQDFISNYKNLSDNYTVVKIAEKITYENIKQGIRTRYGEDICLCYSNHEQYIIVIKSNYNNYKDVYKAMGLYFDPQKIEIGKELKYNIILRPYNFRSYEISLVNNYIQEHERYSISPMVYMFAGEEVLGNKIAIKNLGDYIINNNMTTLLVENENQRQHMKVKGMDELISYVGTDKVTRGLAMFSFYQERYKYLNYLGPEEITNILYRAITERNIRYIYYKPFKDFETKQYITDFNEYVESINALNERLIRHNIDLDIVKPLNKIQVDNLSLIIIYMGLLISGILLINQFVKMRIKINIAIFLIALIGISIILHFNSALANNIMSFMTALIFPTISMMSFYQYALKKSKSNNIYIDYLKDISGLILCSGISLIGGLLIGTILANNDYLLELNIYRGVKASLLIPSILFVIIYMTKYPEPICNSIILRLYSRAKNALNESIKVKYAMFGIIGAIALIIYMARTGHESNIYPTDIEILVRNFLEESLIARPRFKQFIIGLPSIFILSYSIKKRYNAMVIIFTLLFGIGLTDIINTFCHIRTPIYISFNRVLIGLGLSIVSGFIYLTLFVIIDKLFVLINKKSEIKEISG